MYNNYSNDFVTTDFFFLSLDVDVLQRLGLLGKRPLFGTRSTPQGVIPFKSGVILTPRARIDVPVKSVVPVSLGTTFTLILSVCSHRINSAFLFTIATKRKRLQLGVQFIPGKVLVHLGQNTVYFSYDVHNGQWHNMALEIQAESVTLYTSCGKTSVHANLHFKNEETLDPEGSFRLGKISQNSVPFEGAVCQFDIHPSAKAAHNYCKYIKKQCRDADTYRPNFPPLLPLLPLDPNVSFTVPTPIIRSTPLDRHLIPSLQISHETSQGPNTSALTSLDPVTVLSVPITVPPILTQPTMQPPLQAMALTVTATLASETTPKQTQQSRSKKNLMRPTINEKMLQHNATDVTIKPTWNKMDIPTSAGTKPEPLSTFRTLDVTTLSSQRSPLQVTSPEARPTSFTPVTTAATDGLQTFDLEPSQYSLLAGASGAPGLKGEPGPPVGHRSDIYIEECVLCLNEMMFKGFSVIFFCLEVLGF